MTKTIVLLEKDFLLLRESLLNADENERAAFCFVNTNPQSNRFMVRQVIVPSDSEYASRTPVFNSLQQLAQIRLMNTFRKAAEQGFMEIHSHPFASVGVFSSIDDRNYPGFRDDIVRRKPGSFFLRMVVGQDEGGFTCLYTDSRTNREIPVTKMVVIGRNRMMIIRSCKRGFFRRPIFSRKDDRDDSRFQRNITWLGMEGHKTLGELTLGCVAAGGVMNPFLLAAPRVGIRKFVIVEYDRIEESNYNRLLGLTGGDVGRFKADVIKREMLRFDGSLDIKVVRAGIETEEAQDALQNVDAMVTGPDNDEARLEAMLFAARFMIPLVDMGSAIFLNDSGTAVREKGAQIRVYLPGNPCLVCQGLDMENVHSRTWYQARRSAGYVMGTNESPGSVITLNMAIAAKALSMIIDYVTGLNPIPLHLSFDELRYETRKRNMVAREDCPICGDKGIVGRGTERINKELNRRCLVSPDAQALVVKEEAAEEAELPSIDWRPS